MVLTYHARVFIISCLVLLALLPSADAQNLDTSSAVHASCALPPRYCAGAACFGPEIGSKHTPDAACRCTINELRGHAPE